jgi:hypothetical protein
MQARDPGRSARHRAHPPPGIRKHQTQRATRCHAGSRRLEPIQHSASSSSRVFFVSCTAHLFNAMRPPGH